MILMVMVVEVVKLDMCRRLNVFRAAFPLSKAHRRVVELLPEKFENSVACYSTAVLTLNHDRILWSKFN